MPNEDEIKVFRATIQMAVKTEADSELDALAIFDHIIEKMEVFVEQTFTTARYPYQNPTVEFMGIENLHEARQ